MALEQQMAEAFNGVDPVSGNDVPVGSKPEEVRDDIPAQLSEGEYVVPADVVRFYGVNFFEKLRTKAKAGWQQMEQDGRVGGEPVSAPEMEDDDELPFDVSELDAVEMAEGGVVSPLKTATSNTVTYKEYVNDAGVMRLIPFFGDMPMSVIPDGFYLKGSKPEAEEEAPAAQAQKDDGGSDDNDTNIPEPVDYTKLSDVELAKMVQDQTSFGVDDVAKMGIGLVSPVIGGLVSLAMADSARRTRNELERRINDPATPDAEKAKYGDMLEKAQAGRVGILDKLLGKATDLTAKPKDVIGEPLALPADMRKAIEAEVYRGSGPTEDTMNKLRDSGFEGFGVPMDSPAAYQASDFTKPPGTTTPGARKGSSKGSDPFEDARVYNLDGGDDEGATAADISAVKGQSTTAEVTSRPTYDTEKVQEISRSGGGYRGGRAKGGYVGKPKGLASKKKT